ncbi:MAG TPA: hypothetical protein VFQ73_17040 [Flavisolibacter sp.]|nr:hypothetical protein [Flavisolibacter sp.]
MFRFFFIILLLFFNSCATTSGGKEVKQDTEEKRKLPVIYYGKSASGDYYIYLRTRDFFDYHEKGELYAGTYTIEGNNLSLAFQNNIHPDELTNKGIVDKTKGEIIIIAKNTSANRRMMITTPE